MSWHVSIDRSLDHRSINRNAAYDDAEGENGALPNLDLLNVVDRIARFVARQTVTLLDPTTPIVGWMFSLKAVLQLPYEITATLSFMAQLAMGEPTGDHGLYHRYNIEALTIKVASSFNNDGSMVGVGRVVEGTIHCVSNLIESFHQSFYYYLLPLSYRYVSIGQYMISLGLIVLPLPLCVLPTLLAAEHPLVLASIARILLFEVVGVAVYFAAFHGLLVCHNLEISSSIACGHVCM